MFYSFVKHCQYLTGNFKYNQCTEISQTKACFRRRTFHVPNLMQMSLNKDLSSLTLGSAHVKFGV